MRTHFQIRTRKHILHTAISSDPPSKSKKERKRSGGGTGRDRKGRKSDESNTPSATLATVIAPPHSPSSSPVIADAVMVIDSGETPSNMNELVIDVTPSAKRKRGTISSGEVKQDRKKKSTKSPIESRNVPESPIYTAPSTPLSFPSSISDPDVAIIDARQSTHDTKGDSRSVPVPRNHGTRRNKATTHAGTSSTPTPISVTNSSAPTSSAQSSPLDNDVSIIDAPRFPSQTETIMIDDPAPAPRSTRRSGGNATSSSVTKAKQPAKRKSSTSQVPPLDSPATDEKKPGEPGQRRTKREAAKKVKTYDEQYEMTGQDDDVEMKEENEEKISKQRKKGKAAEKGSSTADEKDDSASPASDAPSMPATLILTDAEKQHLMDHPDVPLSESQCCMVYGVHQRTCGKEDSASKMQYSDQLIPATCAHVESVGQ